MASYILLLIALYVVYKLVFDLIIPVFRATRQVRHQFRSMNEHMQQQANARPDGRTGTQAQPQKPSQQKAAPGDYIDFEEIKYSNVD